MQAGVSKKRCSRWDGPAKVPPVWWFQRFEQCPIELQLGSSLAQTLEIHWFDNVSFRAEAPAFGAFTIVSRLGQHHNGNAARSFFGFDSTEDFDSIELGQIQIQQHQLG